jgi:hypothetical protein
MDAFDRDLDSCLNSMIIARNAMLDAIFSQDDVPQEIKDLATVFVNENNLFIEAEAAHKRSIVAVVDIVTKALQDDKA